MKMMYTADLLRVLFLLRKCMSSCWKSVGARTCVETVSPAKPTGSAGFSAAHYRS